ncbi:hypothetical protein RHGRI_002835 [Rhododendron griersonianum]|uniref:Cupin type-1 domain-containing protein n=1 Tax=Rhododendron griersonianum TaxID=479676 RepID=A0AAV6LRG8_9ERIC|nr:hypothetical protein RHGRI_002835 [Rhododendron griersonianum]
MAKSSLLSGFFCFLFLFHCSVAYSGRQKQEQHGQRQQGECQLNNLNAQEPQHRIQAEAGVTEFWDYNDDQFQCAGVAACRHIIQPRGLFLPTYTNAPHLIYISNVVVATFVTIELSSSWPCIYTGRGFQGVMMSGCPETFQSSQQSEGGGGRREGAGQRFRDQHQKIRHFREGDVIAIPAGVAHWCYNDGDSELVFVTVEDLGNNQNQLDNNPRKFFLAGNPQQQGQGQQQQQREFHRREGREEHNFGNVFSGFDTEVLAEAFGVDRETARKLQGQDDNRGHIIRVEGDLQVLRPPRSREEQEQQERGSEYRANGLEETICSARLHENINDPSRADIFNPRAGRLTTVNGFNLPILNFLRLSAERGVLYRAGNEGFDWVAFNTHENAMFSTLAGRTSALRAMPVDVLANAYQISRDEARRLKLSREETVLMESRFWSSRKEPWPRMVPQGSTVSKVFGSRAFERYRYDLTLLEAAARNDDGDNAFAGLVKQSTAALLNSYARDGFPYTAWEVKTLLIQGLVSEKAASFQAQRFSEANQACN